MSAVRVEFGDGLSDRPASPGGDPIDQSSDFDNQITMLGGVLQKEDAESTEGLHPNMIDGTLHCSNRCVRPIGRGANTSVNVRLSSNTAPTVPSRPDNTTSSPPFTSLALFHQLLFLPLQPLRILQQWLRAGYGRYGGGMYGAYDGITAWIGLTRSVIASTQQALELFGKVIGAFTSFTQMLVEPVTGVVKEIAGVFGLVGRLREWWRSEQKGTMAAGFRRFIRGGDGSNSCTPRPSKKPLIVTPSQSPAHPT
ncbi:hypothetical protein FRC07_010021 [Ceratobasidium sp. 392]|nr:hypothetical protein FRC07_010021 [Ceratobasidium sp. 392]